MRTLKRVLKWSAIAMIALLIAAQFIRPARSNPATTSSQSIEAHLQMTPEVTSILDRACNDCHSNKTRWPWYSNVAPVSWFVIDHVDHGRSHLNFSEWGTYEQGDAQEMLGQICREIEVGFMPLNSYTRIHREAKMSTEDVKLICDWTKAERARLAR